MNEPLQSDSVMTLHQLVLGCGNGGLVGIYKDVLKECALGGEEFRYPHQRIPPVLRSVMDSQLNGSFAVLQEKGLISREPPMLYLDALARALPPQELEAFKTWQRPVWAGAVRA